MESVGIRSYRERSGPDRWPKRPGVDGVVADKAQTHCPRLERLVPKVLKNRKCLDTYELLNTSCLTRACILVYDLIEKGEVNNNKFTRIESNFWELKKK